MTAKVAGVVSGGRLELLEEPRGLRDGRVTVTIEEDPTLQTRLAFSSRREFMRLPLSERRKIMAEQAERLADHYDKETEWKDWLAGDIVE